MNAIVYNASMLVGIGMVGAGVGMVSIPAALVTVGILVVALTLMGAYLGRKG